MKALDISIVGARYGAHMHPDNFRNLRRGSGDI